MPLSSFSAQVDFPPAADGNDLSDFRRPLNSRLVLPLGAQGTTTREKHHQPSRDCQALLGLGIPENPQAPLPKISIRG